ncbi:MAG: hypothetical protein QOD33_600, partial [Pyrinomonadaceae bacterium]|nr:hypothetical protein [Pyrinomonadaceae bacterium]
MYQVLSKTKIKNAVPRDAVTGNPVRVLVVAPSFDILGGQAVQAARLITRLRELPEFAVGFLPINPRLPGVLRNLQAIKYLRTVVTSLYYLASLLLKIPRYDVIHIFSASYFSFVLAPTPAILIAKLFGKKSLLNYHSGEAEDHFNRWPSAVRTIRLANRVAVPSAYLVSVLAKFRIGSVAINNLIELDQFTFRERPQLRPRFLANRNLETHYGVDQVLRAFALIQQEVPDAELLVAGDGSRRDALVRLAGELGLRQTRFTGRVEQNEIIAQYQYADIYLNGSEIDNQPLSILEAFACGLPVVTTDAGGIPDMISDGQTGFVVKRGDHEALAKRALQLLSEPALARALAKRAHAECERYSWTVVRAQWQKLYLDLASRPAKKPRGTNVVRSSRIARLRKMGVAELRVRGSQATAAFAERRGWSSLTSLPSDQALMKLFVHSEGYSHLDLLAYFRGRTHVAFFGLTARESVVAELRRRWPEAEQEIVAAAERIVAGRFDLLGFKQLSFGNPIDWRLEPVSGKSTPLVHWSKLDYLNPEITGDKKIVWELNRHQYFLKLGQAYWLTGAEKYAETFVAQLSSWMDQNPPKLGINWASSLEVSFRSISWLWALHFFKDSPALTASIFARVLKFLYLSARHLETYLSTYFSPNTHLTGEALGLFYLGTFLPEFSEAARWRRTGQEILSEQLAKQVKPDGVYFEQSSYYHRYTTDFYTHLLIMLRQAAGTPGSAGIRPASHPAPTDSVDSTLTTTLTALLDHLLHLTRPDGTSPLFGDDDGGRLVTLDRRAANDFRAALSNGALLFNRGDYKFVAGSLAEETLWLLGPTAAAAFDEITAVEPVQQSRDFPDGGYYIMRDGWHAHANYLLFDCGPHGASNCGHAHADALAIEVAANGQPLLIDPGTCSYTGAKDVRDWFRSSPAHNALTVD